MCISNGKARVGKQHRLKRIPHGLGCDGCFFYTHTSRECPKRGNIGSPLACTEGDEDFIFKLVPVPDDIIPDPITYRPVYLEA